MVSDMTDHRTGGTGRKETKMKSFQISANFTDMGIFEGADESAAVLAYTQDAGYDSVEAAAESLGQTVEEYNDELVVTEVA